MRLQRENRPAGELDGLQETAFGGTSIVPRFTPEMAAARAQGTLLLLVLNPETGRYRRRLYLSLSAAQKAVERAEARGHIAHVILGRFSVVEVV